MNIRKLIRNYLIFTIVGTSSAVIGQSEVTKYYYANVLSAIEEMSTTPFEREDFLGQSIMIANQNHKLRYNHLTESPYSAGFAMVNKPVDAFALPGEKDKEIMQMQFKAGAKPLLLDEIKFKIVGLRESELENVTLMVGEEILKITAPLDGYVEFKNLGYELGPGMSGSLRVLVDLSENAKAGKRLRLDIEEKEDIKLIVGGQSFLIREHYPIQGKYLSIVKRGI